MDEKDTYGAYTDEIQGNILRGFNFPHARYVLVAFPSAAVGRAWVAKIRASVSLGGDWQAKPSTVQTTLAFTDRGLAALGVRPEILAAFSEAFRAGMRGRHAQTGDAADEKTWDEVFRQDSIHALVSLYGDDCKALNARVDELYADVVKVLYVQPAARPDDREHFGFRDGISQPIQHDDKSGGWKSDVPIREFLIFASRWNEGKSKPGDPALQLGTLGTYLVYRKLEQHVDRFLRFVQGWPAAEPELIAAKVVGRWPNGTPVTEVFLDPDKRKQPSDDNDFDFRGDGDGRKCPVGAHISRVNPRGRLPVSAGEHRILRRGVPYGERLDLGNYKKDPRTVGSGERGLVFIALNARIEKQFEFLQKRWINHPKFNGLDGMDPIAHSADGDRGTFRLEKGGASRAILEDVVELRGGEYFFVPSIQALSDLGDGKFS